MKFDFENLSFGEKKDLAFALCVAMNFADMPFDDWYPVVTALKNLGFSLEEVHQMCEGSEKYNAAKVTAEYRAAHGNQDLSTICGKAKTYAPNFDYKTFFTSLSTNYQSTPADETPATKKDLKIQQPTTEYESLIADAQKNLPKFLESQEFGEFRGFSLEVLQAAKVGYLPAESFSVYGMKFTDAVVVPNDLRGVYFRAIEGKAHRNTKPTATTTIYLPDKEKFDIIVTEGFFNGLSLLEYAKRIGYGIIATGGTSGTENLLARLKQLRREGKNFRVIVAFDNDTNGAGQKAAAKLLVMLKAAGFIAVSIDFTKTADVDINDVYRRSATEFFDMFNDALGEAQNALAAAELQADSSNEIDALQLELQAVQVKIADFESEKQAALENLKNLETFDFQTCFKEEVIQGAAFASLYDKNLFARTRRDIQSSNKADKFLKDWLSAVKEIAKSLSSRAAELKNREDKISKQINSARFALDNDVLGGLKIPEPFSISAAEEILKDTPRGTVTICRVPVIITHKFISVDTGVVRWQISFKENGKWHSLSPLEQATIADNKKIVPALASLGVPVNSTNANGVIDYLDAFMAQNQANFQKTYTTQQFGWHNDGNKDIFLDPRRNCTYEVDGVAYPFKCESKSQFARALSTNGDLEIWKNLYFKVKEFPLARFIVAACVAAPLLKILNLRNFIVYPYGKTRAGKTTALLFGASAVGSESMLRSFDATKNGLTGAASEANDYVLAIDEKQVADKKISDQLQSLIYALANGVGRTKMNKDSTLREVGQWRCVAVMTGETKITADNVTGGANTRCLQLDIGKSLLPEEICAEIRQTIKENHGLAFQPYIEQIFEYGFSNLRETFKKLVEMFGAKYPAILSEYRQYVAAITLADMILNVALGVGELTAQEESADMAVEVFKLVPTLAEISDTEREKDMVLDFVSTHPANFIGSSSFDQTKGREIFGKFDNEKGYVYLTVPALKKACNENGFDYRKVASDLVDDGFFVPADTIEKDRIKPRDTVKERIGDVTPRCHRIPYHLVVED